MKRLMFIVLAIFIFGCATSEGEKNAGVYYQQGVNWEGKGDYERAVANYSKAIELDPKFAEAYYGRGSAYYFKGEYDKAWKDVHKSQSLDYQVDPAFLEALREASGRQR